MAAHDDTDSSGPLPHSVSENIGTIAEYCERNEEQVTAAQKIVEKVSLFLGSPGYFAVNVSFIIGWIVWNVVAPEFGGDQVDEPPFFWLQGFVSLNAFIISTTVLIRQNRMSKLAERNAHLDLQISLLSDEKTSKIIAMLEELRRDSPDLPTRPTPKPMNWPSPPTPRACWAPSTARRNKPRCIVLLQH